MTVGELIKQLSAVDNKDDLVLLDNECSEIEVQYGASVRNAEGRQTCGAIGIAIIPGTAKYPLRKSPDNPPLEGSVLQIIVVNYTDKEITITPLNSNLPDISDYKLILA